MENQLRQLYYAVTGHDGAVTRIPGAGSNRRYYRLGPVPSLIGVIGTDRRENEAFLYLCRHFAAKGLPVPEVKAVGDGDMTYLLSDLGDTSLFQLIERDRQAAMPMLEATMRLLPDFQWRGAEGLDFSKCYPVEALDRRGVMWDLNYFKYCFLKTSGLEIDEPALEDDFERLAARLLDGPADTFMYRDFQSRNVMVHDGAPWMIDFQGGRRGPWLYDMVSFLWQAKAAFSDDVRRSLLEVYLDSASRYIPVDRDDVNARLPYFVLFRTLQVLGAYGFRGYSEGKPHFLKSIPFAIANLSHLLRENGFDDLPYLAPLLRDMTGLPKYRMMEPDDAGGLTVRVASFGYNRHGIPRDMSGNGGGYVMDCRGIHNPGRYDEYKRLTGRDREVIEFLDRDGSAPRFLEHVYGLVDESVRVYRERGFSSLMVSFGCTGGQHRSVYCAEHTAAHLKQLFPDVNVRLTHYELGIDVRL